jgi:hypothetical protein
MDEAIGCVGVVVVAGALLLVGGLFVSSKAVLYYEERAPTSLNGPSFNCHYFTGLRTIAIPNYSFTGCKRFVTVGDG